MRAQCDHCGYVEDHVRPVRIAGRVQIICRECRIELGVADMDDLEDESQAHAESPATQNILG